ncbi:hypothetical protein PagCFBP13532_18230 [Pantoea agglomerans]|nr:hypothetical protein PagCFBP13505_07470 [Pantoea agglomerans]TKK30104.1 hypothetical protein PagCFBP13532_18230 [Pantoea agglomerans]
MVIPAFFMAITRRIVRFPDHIGMEIRNFCLAEGCKFFTCRQTLTHTLKDGFFAFRPCYWH